MKLKEDHMDILNICDLVKRWFVTCISIVTNKEMLTYKFVDPVSNVIQLDTFISCGISRSCS